MASDPTLADQLEADADYWVDLHGEQGGRPGHQWMLELADRQRAAAAVVRAHDALLDAIGDPKTLRLLASTFNLPKLHWIADAVERARTYRTESD